jgi:nucleoside triphosphate diphosphatase
MMADKPTLDDALALMRDLRTRCDWDRVQTHESLRPYLIEEAHELDDALRRGDSADTREELGDVLLQVLFHSVIAEEEGEFDINDVAASLITKMRERHPHLFGGGERRDWEEMKAARRESIADGLPAALPTLHRAYRLQERAAGVGFDWDDTEGPARKVEEELAEVRGELAQQSTVPSAGAARAQAHLEDELGDLLFAVINLSRRAGVHPALALDRATDKFARRFEAVEALARERGIAIGDVGIDSLDALWNEVKLAE